MTPIDPANRNIRIRRVHQGDALELQRFYADLSADSRLFRFLGVTSGLSHAQATRFCTPDQDHREGFVAVVPATGDSGRIVGHLCVEPDGECSAEVALRSPTPTSITAWAGG